MKLSEISFSINEYDSWGDCIDEGIFLHFGDTKIRVTNTLEEFDIMINRLSRMVNDIRKNYERK